MLGCFLLLKAWFASTIQQGSRVLIPYARFVFSDGDSKFDIPLDRQTIMLYQKIGDGQRKEPRQLTRLQERTQRVTTHSREELAHLVMSGKPNT